MTAVMFVDLEEGKGSGADVINPMVAAAMEHASKPETKPLFGASSRANKRALGAFCTCALLLFAIIGAACGLWMNIGGELTQLRVVSDLCEHTLDVQVHAVVRNPSFASPRVAVQEAGFVRDGRFAELEAPFPNVLVSPGSTQVETVVHVAVTDKVALGKLLGNWGPVMLKSITKVFFGSIFLTRLEMDMPVVGGGDGSQSDSASISDVAPSTQGASNKTKNLDVQLESVSLRNHTNEAVEFDITFKLIYTSNIQIYARIPQLSATLFDNSSGTDAHEVMEVVMNAFDFDKTNVTHIMILTGTGYIKKAVVQKTSELLALMTGNPEQTGLFVRGTVLDGTPSASCMLQEVATHTTIPINLFEEQQGRSSPPLTGSIGESATGVSADGDGSQSRIGAIITRAIQQGHFSSPTSGDSIVINANVSLAELKFPAVSLITGAIPDFQAALTLPGAGTAFATASVKVVLTDTVAFLEVTIARHDFEVMADKMLEGLFTGSELMVIVSLRVLNAHSDDIFSFLINEQVTFNMSLIGGDDAAAVAPTANTTAAIVESRAPEASKENWMHLLFEGDTVAVDVGHSIDLVGGVLIALRTYQGALRDEGHVKLIAHFQGREVGSVALDSESIGNSSAKAIVTIADAVAFERLATAFLDDSAPVAVDLRGVVTWPDNSTFEFGRLAIPLRSEADSNADSADGSTGNTDADGSDSASISAVLTRAIQQGHFSSPTSGDSIVINANVSLAELKFPAVTIAGAIPDFQAALTLPGAGTAFATASVKVVLTDTVAFLEVTIARHDFEVMADKMLEGLFTGSELMVIVSLRVVEGSTPSVMGDILSAFLDQRPFNMSLIGGDDAVAYSSGNGPSETADPAPSSVHFIHWLLEPKTISVLAAQYNSINMEMGYDHSVEIIGGLLTALETYQGALRNKGHVKLTADFLGEEIGSVELSEDSFGMSTSKGAVEIKDNVALSRLITALIGSDDSVCVSVGGQVQWPDASYFKFDLTIPLKRNSTRGDSSISTDADADADADAKSSSGFDILKYINTDNAVEYWDSASAAQPVVQVTVQNPLPVALTIHSFSFDLLLDDGTQLGVAELRKQKTVTLPPGIPTTIQMEVALACYACSATLNFGSSVAFGNEPYLAGRNGYVRFGISQFVSAFEFDLGTILGETSTSNKDKSKDSSTISTAPKKEEPWASACDTLGRWSGDPAAPRCLAGGSNNRNYHLTVTAVSASNLKDRDTGYWDGESDSYATVFLPSVCGSTECQSSLASDACQAACLMTSVKRDSLSPQWGETKTLAACVAWNEPVSVKVYDQDTAVSDAGLFDAQLSDWGAAPSGHTHTLTQPGSSSTVQVQVHYQCCA